jgi:hypothetical protein
MKTEAVTHSFVEFMPSELEQGTLYISIEYATASHLCACGCGNRVVTPISPADWQLIFDGDSVSLYPSIGNWQFPCQSHYWIRNNAIVWAGKWSNKKIEQGSANDARDLERYMAQRAGGPDTAATSQSTSAATPTMTHRPRWLARLLRRSN